MMCNLVFVDKVNAYVCCFFNDDYAKEVANSLLTEYDLDRVKYAIESNMDLFDLDRWEFAARLHKKTDLNSMLSHIGFNFTEEELDEYISDGDKFFKMIVNPLWDIDFEIMELENYQKLEIIDVEYKKNKEVCIVNLYEDTKTYCEATVDDVVNIIIEEYKISDVSIGEVLSSISIHGLSVEDVVSVYSKVYNIIEDDKVVKITEGEQIEL